MNYAGFKGDLSYSDGYYYTIVGADIILHPYLEFTQLCPEEIKKSLSPECNMVVVKMKLAEAFPIGALKSQYEDDDEM